MLSSFTDDVAFRIENWKVSPSETSIRSKLLLNLSLLEEIPK